MKSEILELFRKAFAHEKPLKAVEKRLAKEWIKRRLARVFPELRGDPAALERAYRELSIDLTTEEGEEAPETVFEVRLGGLL